MLDLYVIIIEVWGFKLISHLCFIFTCNENDNSRSYSISKGYIDGSVLVTDGK